MKKKTFITGACKRVDGVFMVMRYVLFLSSDGIRIASSNTIEMLMEHDFDMVVNDKIYRVATPPQEKASKVQK